MKGCLLAGAVAAVLLLLAFGSFDMIPMGWFYQDRKISIAGILGCCVVYNWIALKFARRTWEHDQKWHDPLRKPRRS